MNALLGMPTLIAGLLFSGGGELEIVNPRPTFGHLGPTRDKSVRLPGDHLHFAFDVKNLSLDKAGRANFTLLVQVFDPKGELTYQQGPRNILTPLYFGGTSVPCTAQLTVPLSAEPGEYTMKISVEDRGNGKKGSFTAKGQVGPKGFGLIRIGTFADRDGRSPTPAVGVVGESLFVNFSAIGFGRDKKTKQPDLEVTLRVLDDKGKPTLPKPMSSRVNAEVAESAEVLPFQFGLVLDRIGTYTVEVTAHDHLSGKSTRFQFHTRILAE